MSDNPVNFIELLNKPLSDYPDRPNLPGGKHFYGKLISVETGVSKEKKTPFLRFNVRLTDPGEDVSQTEMAAITNAGFSLSDYDVSADFYITPLAMPMLRRFMDSLGFPGESVSAAESLKLDRETGLPTADTQDILRGLDVICKTPLADDRGRVFSRLDQIAGAKR